MSWYLNRSLLLSFIAIFFSSGCHSGNENQRTKTDAPSTTSAPPIRQKDSLTKAQVVADHHSIFTAGLDYAYYLPSIFSDSAQLPVIIFFDPHGDGEIPVKKYAALAEKNRYILIGSNNSKNGMTLEDGIQIANNLIHEADDNFHAEKNKITLCGFSGGAKVALSAGVINTEVPYIVYCGAAIPIPNKNHALSLLGFAGLRDMNYSDLVQFHFSSDLRDLPHYLIEWKGKHEWPDTDDFKYAFHPPFNHIPSEKLLKMDAAKLNALQKEQDIKQQLVQAFNTEDLNWWKQEIAQLNKQKNTQLMNERLLGYISLACYSLGNRILQQNNLAAAQKILTIYRMADPDNTDMKQMWERYHQLKGQ